MNPLQVGFVSLTGGAVSGDDAAYLRWHLLDHLPEQYSIPGVRLGTRWRMDDELAAARLVASDALEPVRHAVVYWITDPVDETLRSFAALGRRMAEVGRYPEPATSHLLGAFHLQHGYASPRVLVSAEAIPFRPHRGVVVLVEEVVDGGDVAAWARWHHTDHVPELLAAHGVAGVYQLRSSSRLGLGADQGARYGVPMWDPGNRLVTIVYLDGAVIPTAASLEPLLRARWTSGAVRPELVAPMRSMVEFEAWPS